MAAHPEKNTKSKGKATRRERRRAERQNSSKPETTGRIRTRAKKPETEPPSSNTSQEKLIVRRASPEERKKRPRGKPKEGRDYQPLIYAKNGKRIEDLEHEVGYGKAPEKGKFKSGQSGNPKGRPKGRKNISTLFKEALQQKIVSRSGNREKTITAREGIVQRAVHKALEGDPRFIKLLMEQDNLFDMELLQEQVEQAENNQADEDDAAILEEFMRQIREKETDTSSEDEDDDQTSGEGDSNSTEGDHDDS